MLVIILLIVICNLIFLGFVADFLTSIKKKQLELETSINNVQTSVDNIDIQPEVIVNQVAEQSTTAVPLDLKRHRYLNRLNTMLEIQSLAGASA